MEGNKEKSTYGYPQADTFDNEPLKEGKKFDTGKPDWTYLQSVLPALEQAVRVFEFGAKKYERDNWMLLDSKRLKRAILGHVLQQGLDDESGLEHMAHALTSILMYLTLKSKEST